MTKTAEDFTVVSITIEFRGENYPGCKDPAPLPELSEWSVTLPANEVSDTLDEISEAASEGRLFGWMQTQAADAAIESGEWQRKSD